MQEAENQPSIYQRVMWTADAHGMRRLGAFMGDDGIHLLGNQGLEVIGCWSTSDVDTAGVGKLMCITAASSTEVLAESRRMLVADKHYQDLKVDEPSATLMQLTDYSPTPSRLGSGLDVIRRAYEFRTYTAAPERLSELNSRFRNHTLRLFRKHGLNSVAYWKLLPFEADAERTLFYLLWHPSQLEGQEALARLKNDPEWKSALAESHATGPLTIAPPDGVQSAFYNAVSN